MELAGQLIIGPGLFILGLFFAMLPFVTVRIFGVVLLSFAEVALVIAGFQGVSYRREVTTL